MPTLKQKGDQKVISNKRAICLFDNVYKASLLSAPLGALPEHRAARRAPSEPEGDEQQGERREAVRATRSGETAEPESSQGYQVITRASSCHVQENTSHGMSRLRGGVGYSVGR